MDFERIYVDYFNDVYNYVWRLSNDRHIASEVTSDTFFKAMRSVEHFRGDCDLRVWLCQIAKNSYFSYIKKKKRFIGIEDTTLKDAADPNISVDEQVANREQAAKIQELLHTLSEPYKEVFMWRVFAGLSFKEIGQIFGKSDNWACVTYHRARTMLKNELEGINHEK